MKFEISKKKFHLVIDFILSLDKAILCWFLNPSSLHLDTLVLEKEKTT